MTVSDNKQAQYIWLAPILSRRLPVLIGLVSGSLLALLIANGAVFSSFLLMLAAPGILILIRYPFAAVMIWLCVFPYFVSPLMTEVSTMHWVLHRLLMPMTLGFVIVRRYLDIRKRKSIRPDSAEIAMLIFLAVCFFSILLWSQQPVRAVVNLYDRVFVPFCAYWLIRLTVSGKKDLERFLWVALVTFIVQVSISLISWFAPQILMHAYQFNAWNLGRTVGTLRSAGVYSSTLVLLSLLLYHYALSCHIKWRRHALIALFALAIFAVFLSFSRSSWVGIAAVLTGLLIIYTDTTLRLLLVLVLLVAVLGSYLMVNVLTTAYERLTSEIAQRSIGGRVIVNNAMIEMIKERPFWGWGYNRYRYYIDQYKVPVGDISIAGSWNTTSHNTYLTIMTELGIPTLLIYFFPVFWWLLRSLHIRQSLPNKDFWGWRLVIVLWLAMVHMFIESNFMDMISNNPFGTTLWWMTLGFIAIVTSSHPSEKVPL